MIASEDNFKKLGYKSVLEASYVDWNIVTEATKKRKSRTGFKTKGSSQQQQKRKKMIMLMKMTQQQHYLKVCGLMSMRYML